MNDTHDKVTASHLKRTAYLYVRQSTLRQVEEHGESTQRQYGLRQRAVALGWAAEQVVIIDDDLGHSGAHATDRRGFQRLVSEVGLGKAGIVMGLEVSRLARNSADWHRLLEICALTETLILDEDGLYDPRHFNDRLVLGLKGTMSEAELHLLRARMRGGVLSKARRGELKCRLPVGLVYDEEGHVQLDPDRQIQDAVRLLFTTFRRVGSAFGVVKAFREQGLSFPRRQHKGPHKGEVLWEEALHCRVLQILHNPRYAGAFFYGRTHVRQKADGTSVWECLPREQWHTFLPDAHVGYISFEEFEENQRRLSETCHAFGLDRHKTPPREGPALLQGLVLCGVCGNPMTVHYHSQQGHLVPEYVCQRACIEHATKGPCQRIAGAGLDEAVGRLVAASVTPLSLEVALSVQEELQTRLEEANRLRYQQVERAQYEADLARRRYMQIDPDNRLVADTLEADWNHKLRALAGAQETYEQGCQADRQRLTDEQREQILALATQFPALWNDPQTAPRERKRMVRLLIEDVTLLRNEHITAHVRFKGGATQTLTLPRPQSACTLFVTPPSLVEELGGLLAEHTYGEAAEILNARGLRSSHGQAFHARLVWRLKADYGLKDRFEHLRAQGLKTLGEMAVELDVPPRTVRYWQEEGLLKGHRYNDKNQCLYDPLPDDAPARIRAKKLHGASMRERGAV